MKLFKLLGKFWNKIRFWFRDRKIKKLNKDLREMVIDQEKERKIFLNEFRFYLRKYLRKDASGKYIPIKGKNKAEIYETIMHVHGACLKELNIRFSKNLRITI